MIPTSIIGMGAGGHAKVVIEILKMQSDYRLVGLLDSNPDLKGKKVAGLTVIGGDEMMQELMDHGVIHFFNGVGYIDKNNTHKTVYEKATQKGFKPIVAIHPQTIISSNIVLGKGITVMAGAVINHSTSLGINIIINTGAIIEHDCVIGNHVHIATGARLGGGVHVEDDVLVGIGATVRQGITIGRNAIIGAGAVVVKDVLPDTVVCGVPARKCNQRQ